MNCYNVPIMTTRLKLVAICVLAIPSFAFTELMTDIVDEEPADELRDRIESFRNNLEC